MKNAFESGRCTAAHCRMFLENGQGHQVQNPDGSLDRFCERHWHEWVYKLDVLEAAVEAMVVLLVPSILFGVAARVLMT